MNSIVQNALKKTFVPDVQESPSNRFRMQSTSGAVNANIDYFKLAEEEFGFSVRPESLSSDVGVQDKTR